MRADQIKGRPWAVADDLHPVLDGALHLRDVRLQVFDPIIVRYRSVRIQRVAVSQTVFCDQQRQAIAFIYRAQRCAEPNGVYFPAKPRPAKIGVADPFVKPGFRGPGLLVMRRLCVRRVLRRLYRYGIVIVESQKVGLARFQ